MPMTLHNHRTTRKARSEDPGLIPPLETKTPITIRRLVSLSDRGATGGHKVGYDPVTQILHVCHPGGLYQHRDVPPEVFARFVNSEKPSVYYIQCIMKKYIRDRIGEGR